MACIVLSNQRTITSPEVSCCRLCRGKLTYDPNTGERVCCSCGVVSETPGISASYFSGSFSSGLEIVESLSNIEYDIDLPAFIDTKNVDAHGKGIRESYELYRLRKLNNLTISRDPKRRSLSKAIETIRKAAEMLGLSDAVAEMAYEIYRKCNGKGEKRRKPIVGVALASVYVACTELGIARSAREIENVMKELNARNFHHYYNFLLNHQKIHSTAQDASSFVSRIAAKAGLSGKIERKAIDILLRVKDSPVLISKKAVPLAASALYLAAELSGEPITQLRIACASEVTPVTIRKRSLEISQILENAQHAEATLDAGKPMFEEQTLEEPLVAV